MTPQTMQVLLPVAVVVLILALRMRSLSRGRPLRLQWLWVSPAIVLAVAAVAVATAPPDVFGWAWMFVAFLAGAGLGWTRGRMMHISVDPESNALIARATPLAMLFILVLVLLRMGMRTLAYQEAGAMQFDLHLMTDLFAVFAVGMIGFQRVEMWLRGQRLLAEARAGRLAG